MEKIAGECTSSRFIRFLSSWGHTLLSGFVIYNVFFPTSPLLERAIFLGGIFSLIFLHQIISPGSVAVKRIHTVFLVVSLVVFGYIIVNFIDIEARSGLVSSVPRSAG